LVKLLGKDKSKTEGVIKYHDSDEDYSAYHGASFFIRLSSSLLDGIFLGVSQKAIHALILFLVSAKKNRGFVIDDHIMDIFSLILLFIPSYFIVLRPLKKNGHTLAKKIFGLKVIRDDFSTHLNWLQIVFREFFCKIISVILFPISLASILFRKDRRTLHDFMCSTRVIKVANNN